MKKSLIALAVLAASGAAMAQSSVTLFGIVDVGVGYVNNATPAGGNKWGLGTSGNATSRIGFRGVEDLGGGLKAGFWLEGEVFGDDGNAGGLNFKRRSTVGLEGNFGEVRLGRDQVAGYNKTSSYDLFGQTGIGQFSAWRNWDGIGFPGSASGDENGIRANNLISYYTPNFSGFKAGISYGFDEVNGESNAGRYAGGNVSYDNGPISVALSYDRLETNHAARGLGDRDNVTLGASYNFGVAKIIGIAQRTEYSYDSGAFGDRRYNNYALGVAAPVGGAGEVKLQYARYDQKATGGEADQLSLGYVHNLSKRTAVYGTVAYLKNKDGSSLGLASKGINTTGAVNQKQTGVQVGVRHSF
ncbi:porin [Comamonas endophytica]|uniref:Porin n=1 Tax=Comamonas endophytica TaxID=2949090 RepID=A0ABY6GE15_9BURK|nr:MULTISPECIES: porin [unclassified Acidovorax]MCD2512896.1 porin [Acidovorax sp. D4N7]UYG52757.1 porin [Acidovorax sp. 5MLIR]